MNGDNKDSIRYAPESDEPQRQSDNHSESDPSTGATVIAEGMTLTGDLLGVGDVLIQGTVVGKIKLNGTVTVAKAGFVKGPILADSVYVAGSVEGNIAAKNCLRLEITGSVTGDVVVSSFIIRDGAYFSGRSHMTKPGEEPIIEY